MAELRLQNIAKPAAGQRVVIPVEAGQNVKFDFALSDAVLVVENGQLQITFPDGSVVVLENAVAAAADGNNAPSFIDQNGSEISSHALLSSLGVSEQDFETAAGGQAGNASPNSSGSGEYGDDAGNMLQGFDRLGRLDVDPIGGERPWVDGVSAVAAPIESVIDIIPIDTPEFPEHLISSTPGALTFNEAFLRDGTQGGPEGPSTLSGYIYFQITSNNGLGGIVINGTTYAVDAGGNLVGFEPIPGNDGTFTSAQVSPQPNGIYLLVLGYELGGPTTHTGEGRDMAENVDSLMIAAVTQDGTQSAPVTASVNVVDDVPMAFDESDALGDEQSFVTLNVLDNDLFGADGPADAASLSWGEVRFDGQVMIVGDDGSLTGSVDGEFYGTVGREENGDLTYTRPRELELQGKLEADYTIKDKDNDTDDATATITVTGNKLIPEIYSQPSALTVHEDGLDLDGQPLGTHHGEEDHPTTASGSLAITSIEALATITVGGLTLSNFVIDPDTGKVTFDSNGIENVPNGVFEVTGLVKSGDVYTLSYKYTLTNANQTHDDVNVDHESLPGKLQVPFVATDTTGDSTQAGNYITIDILDDNPVAYDESASMGATQTSATLNVLANGDVYGADGPADADAFSWGEVRFDGQVMVVGDDGSLTGSGDSKFYGTLVREADGDLTYTRPRDVELAGKLEVDYTLEDKDGDTDPATATITVTGNKLIPEISTAPGQLTVHEDGLAGIGTHAGQENHPTEASGSLAITSIEALATITVGGLTLSNFVIDPDTGKVTFDSDGIENVPNGVFEVTGLVKNGDVYTLSYKYTLTNATQDHIVENVDHESLPSKLLVPFVATDTTGDSTPAGNNITIDILDDNPAISGGNAQISEVYITKGDRTDVWYQPGSGSDDDASFPNASRAEGEIAFNFGADGPASSKPFTWSDPDSDAAFPKLEAMVNGKWEKVSWEVSGDGLTLQGKAGGYVVAEVTMDVDINGTKGTGGYSVELFTGIRHDDPDGVLFDYNQDIEPNNVNNAEPTDLNFKYIIKDSDGDTTTGTLTVNVQDDVPSAEDSTGYLVWTPGQEIPSGLFEYSQKINLTSTTAGEKGESLSVGSDHVKITVGEVSVAKNTEGGYDISFINSNNAGKIFQSGNGLGVHDKDVDVKADYNDNGSRHHEINYLPGAQAGTGTSEAVVMDLDGLAFGFHMGMGKFYATDTEVENGAMYFYRSVKDTNGNVTGYELVGSSDFKSADPAGSGNVDVVFNADEFGGFDRVVIVATPSDKAADNDDSDFYIKDVKFDTISDVIFYEQGSAAGAANAVSADGIDPNSYRFAEAQEVMLADGTKMTLQVSENKIVGYLPGESEAAFTMTMNATGTWDFMQHKAYQLANGGPLALEYMVKDNDGDYAIAKVIVDYADAQVNVTGGKVYEAKLEDGSDKVDDASASVVTSGEITITNPTQTAFYQMIVTIDGKAITISAGQNTNLGAAIQTDHGKVVITQNTDTNGKAIFGSYSYTYTLTGNYDHDSQTPTTGEGLEADLGISVVVKGPDGGSSPAAEADLIVVDDNPYLDIEAGADVTENGAVVIGTWEHELGADQAGAGTAKTVVEINVNGTYYDATVVANGYQVVVNGDTILFNTTDDKVYFTADPTTIGERNEQMTIGIRITDSDNDVAVASANITIDIQPNSPPVAVDNFNTVNEDGPQVVTGNILANDSDPDGDALSITMVNGAAVNFSGSDAGGKFATFDTDYGQLKLYESGNYSFEVDASKPKVIELYASNTAGDQVATVKFPYTMTDGKETDDATLSIDIVPNKILVGTPGNDGINILTGGSGNDVLIGDPGGMGVPTTTYTNYNVAVMIDTSGSMADTSGAVKITAAKLALLGLVKQYAEYDGSVDLQVIGFAANQSYNIGDSDLNKSDLQTWTNGRHNNSFTTVEIPSGGTVVKVMVAVNNNGSLIDDNNTYNFQFSGTGDNAVLQYRAGSSGSWTSLQNVSWVGDSAGNTTIKDILAISATGGTNYEAGLNSANAWFEDNASNGYTNVAYFVTDGAPTYYYQDQFTVIDSWAGANTNNANNIEDGATFAFTYNINGTNRSGTATYDEDSDTISSDNARVRFQVLDNGTIQYQTRTSTTGNWGNTWNNVSSTARWVWVDETTTIVIPDTYVVGSTLYFDAEGNVVSNASNATYRLQTNTDGDNATLQVKGGGGNWSNVSSEDIVEGYNTVRGGNGSSTNDIERNQSEAAYDALVASLNGNIAVNAIGINLGTEAQAFLDNLDNTGGAQPITSAAQLLAALQAGSTIPNPTAVGDDVVFAGEGGSLLFGDAINADYLLQDNSWNHDSLAKGDSLNIVFAYLKAQNGGIDPSYDQVRHFIVDNAEKLGADDTVLGKDGNLRGGDDIMIGGAGDDIMFGQGGNDILAGGGGNDSLHAGGAADTHNVLSGGQGSDHLYGGAGHDTFVWGKEDIQNGDKDTVHNFELGKDTIDISGLLNELGAAYELHATGASNESTLIKIISGTGANQHTQEIIVENVKADELYGSDSFITGGVEHSNDAMNHLLDGILGPPPAQEPSTISQAGVTQEALDKVNATMNSLDANSTPLTLDDPVDNLANQLNSINDILMSNN